VPQWEKPEHIRGLTWLPPEQAVERALRALAAEKPDVTIVAVHGGLGRPPERALAGAHELPGENPAAAIAERFPQLAAVVYGHSHRREPELRVGNVLLVQPKNWAMDVARIELELEREVGGAWRLLRSASRLLPVTAETRPDPAVLELARPYHEAAETELDRPVTHANAALSGARGHFEDSALVDAIHEVQRHYTGAPVSFASLLRDGAELRRGPVTRRELAGLYVYDNELYALEGDGRMVRSALENAARCFLSCPEPACERGPLRNPAVPGFNCDAAQGVEYELDLRRPEGSRVTRLAYRGEPLRDDEPLRIAVNSYRAAGSAGYSMFRDARVAWRSGREIRELMAEYFGAPRPLPEKPDGNWRLLPPRAVETLAAEAPGR
jgi:2',3'-cyclic-nucleotide 2'-phosphodiesterase/3'-nucleotidase